MSRKETPLQAVKRLFGDKDKLVDSVTSAFSGLEEQADDLRERLRTASNKKLLKLSAVTREVQSKYGSKAKLAEAAAAAVGKAKDAPYVEKLTSLSLPKLLDLARSAERRASRAAKKSAA